MLPPKSVTPAKRWLTRYQPEEQKGRVWVEEGRKEEKTKRDSAENSERKGATEIKATTREGPV